MKHNRFSKKAIALSSVLFVIILCITFFLGSASRTNNTSNGGIITTYADSTPLEKQKYDKEIELKRLICNFDEENIVNAWVFLEISEADIIDATIFIVSHEEITNSAEKDELMTLASESLDLDSENIYITYMDVETFNSSEVR